METGRVEGGSKKLPKPNNVITIPCDFESTEFYKKWCNMLRPFVSLTNKEVDVVANFLYQRYKLSKLISDPQILDTMVMSEDIKIKVMEGSNITKQHFYVIMSNLRKNNVIVGNVLNSKLIPNRRDDSGIFQLIFLFKNNSSS